MRVNHLGQLKRAAEVGVALLAVTQIGSCYKPNGGFDKRVAPGSIVSSLLELEQLYQHQCAEIERVERETRVYVRAIQASIKETNDSTNAAIDNTADSGDEAKEPLLFTGTAVDEEFPCRMPPKFSGTEALIVKPTGEFSTVAFRSIDKDHPDLVLDEGTVLRGLATEYLQLKTAIQYLRDHFISIQLSADQYDVADTLDSAEDFKRDLKREGYITSHVTVPLGAANGYAVINLRPLFQARIYKRLDKRLAAVTSKLLRNGCFPVYPEPGTQ